MVLREKEYALFSTQSTSVIKEYLDDLRKRNKKEDSLKMYVHMGEDWIQEKRPKRSCDTVFLPNGKISEIITEVKSFFESEDFFKTHNIPHCRTMVFHGQPGNGKSSSIKAIASELNLSLFSLCLSNASLDDQLLTRLVMDVDKNSIVVVEDIDRIFSNHNDNVSSSHVSFATFINLLDGTLTKNGVLFILTCNDYNKLDKTLTRAGRVDADFEFKNANHRIAEKMFLSFYPGKKAESKSFSAHLKMNLSDVPVSSVQEYFIKKRKRNADQASKEVTNYIFKKNKKSHESGYF